MFKIGEYGWKTTFPHGRPKGFCAFQTAVRVFTRVSLRVRRELPSGRQWPFSAAVSPRGTRFPICSATVCRAKEEFPTVAGNVVETFSPVRNAPSDEHSCVRDDNTSCCRLTLMRCLTVPGLRPRPTPDRTPFISVTREVNRPNPGSSPDRQHRAKPPVLFRGERTAQLSVPPPPAGSRGSLLSGARPATATLQPR